MIYFRLHFFGYDLDKCLVNILVKTRIEQPRVEAEELRTIIDTHLLTVMELRSRVNNLL